MKLSLSNIKTIKKDTSNLLTKEVCDYVESHWRDYSNKISIFTEILEHGCQSGIVGYLIYYKQTLAFYEKYKSEINSLLFDLMLNTGIYDFKQLFGEKWDKEDPLIMETTNRNLLAWFGFEESIRNLALRFEELEQYI